MSSLVGFQTPTQEIYDASLAKSNIQNVSFVTWNLSCSDKYGETTTTLVPKPTSGDAFQLQFPDERSYGSCAKILPGDFEARVLSFTVVDFDVDDKQVYNCSESDETNLNKSFIRHLRRKKVVYRSVTTGERRYNIGFQNNLVKFIRMYQTRSHHCIPVALGILDSRLDLYDYTYYNMTWLGNVWFGIVKNTNMIITMMKMVVCIPSLRFKTCMLVSTTAILLQKRVVVLK